MLGLPVSGLRVDVLAPTGQEDLMLLEASDLDLVLALALLGRLVQPVNGELNLTALVVTDYEALLLGLHRAAFGSLVKADIHCKKEECDSRTEVSFEIEDYLDHNRPRRPRGVTTVSEKSGWFQMNNGAISLQYRLATTADLVAVIGDPHPEREVMRRCVDGPMPEGPARGRLERAMEAQAPSLSSQLQCSCSGCGIPLHFFFDVQAFVLQELRDQAPFLYEDTHLLALHYHWPEAQILGMPRHRRMQYVEMLRGQA